ncbi:MAG: triose-phosphate isomerase [Candidatus Cloacimonetes bacterium]|nr:triose-phosphate isomerase [Candidatus Cloacimonadota bacterium]
MRKIYIAGNWKMNLTFQAADDFFFHLAEYLQSTGTGDVQALICPPFTYMELATDTADQTSLSIGAQNVSQYDNGAFTGEISADILSSMDVEYCLVGHSERRQIFQESDSLINQKIQKLRKYFLIPILCVGESLSERESGKAVEVVQNQLSKCLESIEIDNDLMIAYEPVWAIGTGKTASPQQAEEIHKMIRDWIAAKYGEQVAADLPILYGGSVNPANLAELLAQPDIDGGLIGGASLDIESYIKMLKIAQKI